MMNGKETTVDVIPSQPCNIKDWTLCLLGILIVCGFFFINWLVLTGLIVADNDTNVTTILNYTNSLVIFVAGYFFGASKSNTDKDKTNADLASAIAGTGTGGPPPAAPTTVIVTPDKTQIKTGDAPPIVTPPPPPSPPSEEEIINELAKKYVAEGMTPEEAQNRARQELTKSGD